MVAKLIWICSLALPHRTRTAAAVRPMFTWICSLAWWRPEADWQQVVRCRHPRVCRGRPSCLRRFRVRSISSWTPGASCPTISTDLPPSMALNGFQWPSMAFAHVCVRRFRVGFQAGGEARGEGRAPALGIWLPPSPAISVGLHCSASIPPFALGLHRHMYMSASARLKDGHSYRACVCGQPKLKVEANVTEELAFAIRHAQVRDLPTAISPSLDIHGLCPPSSSFALCPSPPSQFVALLAMVSLPFATVLTPHRPLHLATLSARRAARHGGDHLSKGTPPVRDRRPNSKPHHITRCSRLEAM